MIEEINTVEEETEVPEVVVESAEPVEESPPEQEEEASVSGEPEEETVEEPCEGPMVFIMDEESIKAVKMPRLCPGTHKRKPDPNEASVFNPWLTDKVLRCLPQYVFPGLPLPSGPLSQEDMKKILASFDPLVPKEQHEPLKKSTPMGVGQNLRSGSSRGFTGRGGQVHKVGEDGHVSAKELVDSPLPTVRERFEDTIKTAKIGAADILSDFRKKFVGFFEEKLTALEGRLRPSEEKIPPKKNRRGGTAGAAARDPRGPSKTYLC